MPTSKPKLEVEPKILIVETKDGELRMEIPADAQVTFGPAIPQSRTDKQVAYDNNPGREYALRVYQGSKTNIIAVFTGVRQFREESKFKIRNKIYSEAGKTVWKSDEEGLTMTTATRKTAKMVDVALPSKSAKSADPEDFDF